MNDLFVRLFSLSRGKEDSFTEFFAEMLKVDPARAKEFVKMLFPPGNCLDFERVEVYTQVTRDPIAGTSYRDSAIDMVLRLFPQEFQIGIEIKLDSAEGKGQLKKYLGKPIDKLVLITGWPEEKKIDDYVLSHSKYFYPNTGRYFSWNMFWKPLFSITCQDEHPVVTYTRELFRTLAFDPPHPLVEFLVARKGIERNIAYRNRYYPPLKEKLGERGWRTAPDSKAELKIFGNTSVKNLFPGTNGAPHRLSPWFGVLKLCLRFKTAKWKKSGGRILFSLEELKENFTPHLMIEPRKTDKKELNEGITFVDIWISQKILLEGIHAPQQAASRITAFVLDCLDAAEK